MARAHAVQILAHARASPASGYTATVTSSVLPRPLQLGLDTFGDVTTGPDGQPLHHAAVLRHIVDEAVLADQVGLHFIGVGEHHRPDFAVSAPEIVLAAIASRTSRIHLGSAVTVLSSDDPVRVYQRFSTLDALSNGRAERRSRAPQEPWACRDST